MNRRNKNKALEQSSDSSDSEDDADYSKLKEAAICLTDLGFVPREKRNKKLSELRTAEITRRQKAGELEDQNELNTTPEFKTHVARKLTQILDRSVDVVPQNGERVEVNENTPSDTTEADGIKLFSSSQVAICECPFRDELQEQCTKRRVSSGSDSEEEMARLASAAVSGEEIMNQAIRARSSGSVNDKVDVDGPETILTMSHKKKKKENRDGDKHPQNVEQISCEDGSLDSSKTDSDNVQLPKKKKKKHKLKTEDNDGAKKRLVDVDSHFPEVPLFHKKKKKCKHRHLEKIK